MKIKNVKVAFLEESIIRSGYPMQTGEPADLDMPDLLSVCNGDTSRAKKLSKAPVGSGHNNFLKGIIVQFDLRYPEYFSPQLQRYHWIDIVSSQSKMHRIMSKPLTIEDFVLPISQLWIDHLNDYIKEKRFEELINELPSGYLKWMGISTNYLQLKTIWNQRCKHKHKLDEWRIFGEFIQSLPMQEFITNEPLK